jgi:hypothetical protein
MITRTVFNEIVNDYFSYLEHEFNYIKLPINTNNTLLRIPEHPDSNSGNIRTRNRKYPDTLPAKLIVK